MRAALTLGHGDRSKISYVENFLDPSLGDDDALVRVSAVAVNYHDIFTRRGMPGIRIVFPVITGSDIAGEIVRVGKDVSAFRVGQRVLVDPVIRHGPRIGMIGETTHGGRAEYVSVPESQLIALPTTVSMHDAAALPLAYGTAYRMLYERGRVQANERVLVLGASGGVGVACVQLAKLAGAQVVACASSESKLQQLKDLGADYVVNTAADEMPRAIHKLFGKPSVRGGGGVDVAINFTGGETWEDTERCLAAHGRILTCGATAGFRVQSDLRYVWTFEQNVIGSNGWSMQNLNALINLVGSGQLKPVIDRILPLSHCAEAERLLEDRLVFGKILIAPGD